MKKLEHSALNIVTHPHSPENYIKLFYAAQKLELPVKIRSDQFGSMIHISEHEKGVKNGPILGEIVKYTNIDKDSVWYDLVSKKEASLEDQKKIKSLPDHLKPNMSRFSFIFYPDTHLMVFESFCDSKNLSPNFAYKIINDTLNNPELFKKFGKVSVTIVPETDKIDKILSLNGLRTITMVTNRPNPDDINKVEGQVKQRLTDMNAISEERTLKAASDSELLLDELTKLEAKVAAKNGEVSLKRYNENGRSEDYSTKEHPLRKATYYNPNTSSHYHELIRVGASIKKKIQDWIK